MYAVSTVPVPGLRNSTFEYWDWDRRRNWCATGTGIDLSVLVAGTVSTSITSTIMTKQRHLQPAESLNLQVSSTHYGPSTRERRFKLAHFSSAGGILSPFHSQRYHCSQVWLVTITYPLHVCLWHQFLR